MSLYRYEWMSKKEGKVVFYNRKLINKCIRNDRNRKYYLVEVDLGRSWFR